MGSCENVNLSVIEEPLCGLVIEENLSLETSVQSGSEQQCCSEVDCRLFESNVEPVNDEDGCLGSSGVDDTLCVISGEVTEVTEVLCVIEDGLVGEGENVGDLLLENVLGSECRIGGDFLNEIQSQGDVCNLENGGLCLEKRGSEGEGDCEKPLESSPVTGLQGNFVQMDEMDDKRVSGSSAEGVSNVMVEQIGILAGVETDIHNQISSSQGCEMPSDIILMTGLPDNHPQQNEQEDTKSMGGFSLQVMDGKSDSSAETETVSCNQSSPLEGGEMPFKVLHTGDLVSNGDCHGDQKDEKTASDLSAETVTEILETKSDADTCIQVLASRGSQSDLENLHMAESLSICAKPNEQKDDKSVDGPCVERVANVVDDKSVVMTVVSVEFGTHILPLEENACNSKEGAAKIAHNCNCEKSVSPLLCQSFGIVNCGTSKDTPDQDAIGSINSSSVVECSGHTDNEGKDNVIVGCISETKCPEIASSSSRGSGQRSKSRQKTQKKRTVKKSKNTANVPDSHESIRISLKAERRKRSCLSKPARSSMWGLLGHITQFLEQSNGANQVHNQGLGNARRGRGSGKQKKIRASGSSGGSRGNRCASTSRIRLKVKVGKVAGQCCLTNMVPEVVDMLASANASTSDDRTEMYSGTGLELSKLANSVEDKLREDDTVLQLQCFSKLPEKAETFPDGFVMVGQLATKDSENTKIIDKTSGDADDYLGVTSHVVDEASGGAIDSGCTDPGTSPDSEVINLIPDVQANARHQADLHETVLTSSKDVAARRRRTSSKRGKKDGLPLSRNGIMEDGSPGPVSINEAKPSKKHGHRQDMGNVHCSREILASPTSANASSISSSNKELPMEPSVFSRETEHGLFRKALKEESGVESKTFSNLDVDVELSESQNWVPNKTMGRKLPKSGRVSKGRSKASESASKRGNAHKQREKQRKSVNNCKVKDKDACNQIMCKVETHLESGCQKVDGIGKANTGDNTAVTDKSNLDMVVGGPEEQLIPPRKAWVLCDDCHKWRRIPAVLADFIEKTNCKWTCKDSLDKAFAACSIPQEKSNAEINAELDISDASGEEDACDAHLNYKGLERRRSTGYQESTFKCISTNEFLHRKRRSQTIDEIMVCHCESPSKGRLGCGDECLNRILNIECVQGTCPCGDLCSNQQFQKRKYAELEWFRCGKKGYGLKLREDISEGQFLIEYVGEVLDMQSYEARQKEYALKGHRHFYFMTLNGSEVIDACAKGNLGRFINHSCDPNCRTEKWIVNGEICIGLFALRNIKKGEEVTFDYNYVRVFGAAAKKCHCGAPQCRGYIGGDLLNTEVIVQGDSDEEFPEPVMVHEKGVSKVSLKYMRSRANPSDSAEIQTAEGIILKDRHGIDEATVAIGHLENTIEKDDSMNRAAISQLHSSVELEDSKGNLPSFVQPGEMSHQTEDVTSKPMPAVQQETSIEEETMNGTSCYADRLEILSPTMLSISLSDGVDANRNSKSDTVEEKRVSSKSHSLMKVSRSSSSVKKEKVRSNPLNTSKAQVTANKSQMLSIKPKKLLEGSSNGRSEAVEEKLNELLDTDGGISKRKDAPKGYLKLLLLTAASGDSGNGEAIQSNRDLSMILDALLKTKSKAVLIDIINKNGLRMLHNIMKQYRRDFKKIPILRKLLKVLEYLAVRDILTPEHINGGPPCPGMESFRESILSLTEHDDKQVHQIARKFRDRWIPRPVRKPSYLDRDDGRMEIHRGSNCNRFSASQGYWRDQPVRTTEAIDCMKQSMDATTSDDTGLQEGCFAPCVGGGPTKETKTRKRKSRWDQPAETNPDSRSSEHKEPKTESSLLQHFESRPLQGGVGVSPDHIDKVSRKSRNCPGSVHNHCQQDEATRADNERQNIPEDVPPGFSSPQAMGSSYASSTVIDLQQNVCHTKCPFDAIIGQPQEKFISRLPVSYGIPLSIVQQFGTPQEENVESWIIAPGMPFHPFPPLPPFSRDSKDHPPHSLNPLTTINRPAEGRRDCDCPAPCHADETTPCANSQQTFKRARESSYDLGRRYFRQQKWNNAKLGPPWLRKRNGWEHMGDNSRGETCSIGIGNVENELKNSYLSEDVSCRVEKAGKFFYQHSQHQDHH